MKHETRPPPVVASLTMGYGHLRAAYPIAEALGVPVLPVDEPPFSDAREASLWGWLRRMHELLSKPLPGLGMLDGPTRGLMDSLTMIPPLHEPRDHREPTWPVRLLDRLMRRGLGRGMVEHLQQGRAPLVTTFYAPAIIADRAGIEEVYCVVTDADCNRVWAPLDAASTRIRYFAPSRRVVRRLRSFGVPDKNVTLTGFPLPSAVTSGGGESLERRLARRLMRLDPSGAFRGLHGHELSLMFRDLPALEGGSADLGPVVLMFAVGGAGAQSELAGEFLPSLRPRVVDGSLQLQLVAGTREEVHRAFLDATTRSGLGAFVGESVRIIHGRSFKRYYDELNRALPRTDVLWTKPSELSFYPALGMPCILAPPVGAHERYNRRWLREQGVGLKQRRPDLALGWLEEWLEDGTLAAAAWSGFMRLPKHGTERIVRAVLGTKEPKAALRANGDRVAARGPQGRREDLAGPPVRELGQ